MRKIYIYKYKPEIKPKKDRKNEPYIHTHTPKSHCNPHTTNTATKMNIKVRDSILALMLHRASILCVIYNSVGP